MAGGNLGDLSFSLTLKARLEDETKKVLQALNGIDATGKRAQSVLDGVAQAVNSIGGKGTMNIDKINAAFKDLEYSASRLVSSGDASEKAVDKAIDGLNRLKAVLKEIDNKGYSSSGVFSALGTEEQRVEDILQQRRRAREQEARKEAEIENARQEKIRQSAQVAQESYSQEIRAREEKSRAFSAAIKKQMEEEEKLRRMQVGVSQNEARRVFRSYFEPSRQTQPYTPFTGSTDQFKAMQKAYGEAFDGISKKYEELQDKISRFHGPSDNEWLVKTKAQMAEYENQMQRLVAASERLSVAQAQQMNSTYKPYTTSTKEEEQAILQRTQSLKNSILERMDTEKKAAAEAKRAAAEAEKNEKQRQSEIEKTKARIQSLSYALQNLWGKRQEGRSLGIDTSKADAKIHETIISLKTLKGLLLSLQNSNWTDHLGVLGNLGNGRAVSSVNHTASEQAKVNAEKQRAIQLEEKHRQEVAATAAKVRGDLVSAFESARKSASGINSTVQDLKNLFLQGGIVYGVKQFAESIIQTGGEMEKQHIALQSILGDMQNADIMFNNIKELALKSPFTFSELNRDVKQLAAYGVEYEQLYDTTKRLADISAGLGVSFERIALAFGQVQARGWLDGKELRQISYAGIPILNKLSEYYSKKEGQKVSTSDVKKRISNREVDFSDVKQIFWDMTDAGGQFFNMQEVLSETLLGRYNKLKDAWEIMLADFAKGDSIVGGTFKTIIGLVTSLVQNINTIGPALMAVFGTVALKKGMTALGGGIGGAVLSAKGSMATDYAKRLMMGEKLERTELNILATRRQITAEDIKTLASARALTRVDMQRLLVQGKITKEMYAQGYNSLAQTSRVGKLRKLATLQGGTGIWNKMRTDLLKLQLASDAYFTKLRVQLSASGSIWSTFALKGMTAFSLLGTGVKALGMTIWTAIGGLPGLVLTAVTTGIGYIISENAELQQALKQSQDELENRKKQIGEFLKNQDVNKAINGGDTKEIDNMIEEYEDKLKELSPSMSQFFIMNANEKQSHEERLKYLRDEMEAQKKANTVAQQKLSNSDNFESLKDYFEKSQKQLNALYELKAKAQMYNATDTDKQAYSSATIHFDDYARDIARKFAQILPNVGNDPEMQRAAVQMFDNMLAQVNIPEEQADYMRASVMNALGIADGWLNTQVSTEMQKLVEESSSVIADKIRNNIELTDAEKKKVQELMEDAKRNLSARYPSFAEKLQKLLDASNFQAVIKLVYSMQDAPSEFSTQYNKNFYGGGQGLLRDNDKRLSIKNRWSKASNGSGYEATNAAHSDIDQALNELTDANRRLKKGKITRERVKEIEDDYKRLVELNQVLNGDFYLGTKKKSNKDPKKNKGRQEDAALKNLQERLSSLKSARQMYQKYKTIFSDEDAKEKTYKLFPEVKGLNLDDYEKAVKSLMEKFDFEKSPERRKLRTSLYREMAEWLFTEKDKVAFDKSAADFKESMDRLSSQWDLYKELLQKTGSKDYANTAFRDGYLIDDKTSDLMQQYRNKYGIEFGLQDAMSMTDGEAKNKLRGPGQYEMWKKITDLLRNNYVTALQDGADLIKESLSYEEQIAAIREKYQDIIDKQKKAGNNRAVRAAEMQRDKEISSVNYKQLTNSTDYAKFFSRTINQSKTELNKYAKFLKKQLSEALKEGAITAEEYSKKIEEINKRMTDLDDYKFLGGGLNGIIDSQRSKGQRQVNEGQSAYDSAQKAYNTAKLANNVKGMADAEKGMQAGQTMMDGGAELMQGADSMAGSIGMIDKIIHGINDLVQGFNDTFQDIKETAEALGQDTTTDEWSDTDTFFSSFSNASNSATKGWDSLKEGNIGGVISGVVGSWTGWIKGFAQGHDKKLDRQIQIAQEAMKLMQNIADNVNKVVQNTLGGIYNYKMTDYTKSNLEKVSSDYEERQRLIAELNGTGKQDYAGNISKGSFAGSAIGSVAGPLGTIAGGVVGALWGGISSLFNDKRKKLKSKINKLPDYQDDTYEQTQKALKTGAAYDAQLASLMAQRDQLNKQRSDEEKKKNTDKTKLADYDKQIEDVRLQIENFTQEWLKDVYDVDLKSWASQLTDAIVEAWAKGEDAADAYHDTVMELMKDLSKKIISQSIMEIRLQPVLDKYSQLLKDNSGKLGKENLSEIWDETMGAMQGAIDDTYDFLDYAKAHGVDLSETGSLSTSNSIKSVTEETADLLASYINAIRLDVSVNRENITQIAEAVKKLPNLNVIAQSQLDQLTTLVRLAKTRNEMMSDMYDWMKALTNGTKKLSVA